jgi:hypothetical protein
MKKFNLILLTILLTLGSTAGAVGSKIIQGNSWINNDWTRTFTPPSISDTLMGISATQTVSNKTFNQDIQYLADPGNFSLIRYFQTPDISFAASGDTNRSNNLTIKTGTNGYGTSGSLLITTGSAQHNDFIATSGPITIQSGTGRDTPFVGQSAVSGNMIFRSGGAGNENSGSTLIDSGTSTWSYTGNTTISTGNSTNGASGNVIIKVGSAGTTQGKIKIKDSSNGNGTTGTIGHVLTQTSSDGTVAWSAISSDATKLNLSGGTMTGNLLLNNSNVMPLLDSSGGGTGKLGGSSQDPQGVDLRWKSVAAATGYFSNLIGVANMSITNYLDIGSYLRLTGDITTTPVNVGNTIGLRADSNRDLVLWTSTEAANETRSLMFETGNSGVAGSGKILLQTGTAAGTRGKVEINSPLLITDGTQGSGKVLTSDASGNATWATPASPGEVNTTSNVGGGTGQVFKQKTGVNFELRTIAAGSNVTVTNNSTDITIAASSPYTTSIKTTTYTAVDRDELFANTSGGAFTITLPASPTIGMRVKISDYSGNWATNNVTVARNSENIDGAASDFTLNVNGAWVEFIYVDVTRGWNVLQ